MWSLDERKRMVARPMTNVFPSGRKEVFKVRLASGRRVDATANHPFMTLRWLDAVGRAEGWRPCCGAARVPEPVRHRRMDDDEIIMLAHMIGDGSCVGPADPVRQHRRAEPRRGDDAAQALRRDGDP